MAEKLSGVTGFVTGLGVRSVHAVREVGYLAALLVESFYWLVVGFRRRQPVRMAAIFKEAMGVGVNAIYAGLRPATEHKDYVIEALPDRNWITVGGIRSRPRTSARNQIFPIGPATFRAHSMKPGSLFSRSERSPSSPPMAAHLASVKRS